MVQNFVLLLAIAGQSAQPDAQIAFTHVTVVNVETGRLEPDRTVVISGSRIIATGPAAEGKLPFGARVIESGGKYLIPGLWDMHVHAAYPGLDALFLPALLANGITGVRDMFSTVGFRDSARARVKRGEIAGPRLVSSGHILDGTPPIWPGSVAVRNATEAIRAVDSLHRAGADFIKVYSRLTPEAFFAAAREARRLGIPFAGHVPQLVSAGSASDSGQATIEHLTNLLFGCSSRETELIRELAAAAAKGVDSLGAVGRRQVEGVLASYDVERCRGLGRRLAKNRTWMVPTMTVLRSVAYLDDTTLALDPRLKYVPSWFRSGWNPKDDFRFKMLTPKDWLQRKAAYRRQLEIVRVLHQEGVRFLAGTDLANPYVYPGFSLHEELRNLVAAGFTPAEALRAATFSPAAFFGATDSLGTVAAGKVADLVLLDENPLADIGNTERIRAVVAGGRYYDRAALDQLLGEVALRATRPPGP
jgi:imidazolonepropionase-like amidohydrolase